MAVQIPGMVIHVLFCSILIFLFGCQGVHPLGTFLLWQFPKINLPCKRGRFEPEKAIEKVGLFHI